jgi:hypothetical protein
MLAWYKPLQPGQLERLSPSKLLSCGWYDSRSCEISCDIINFVYLKLPSLLQNMSPCECNFTCKYKTGQKMLARDKPGNFQEGKAQYNCPPYTN